MEAMFKLYLQIKKDAVTYALELQGIFKSHWVILNLDSIVVNVLTS